MRLLTPALWTCRGPLRTAKEDKALKKELFSACYTGNAWFVQTIIPVILKENSMHEDALIEGYTPLYIEASPGHVEVVKLLLRAGVSVNQAQDDSMTPLVSAAEDSTSRS
jgi:ankyrin repeat protein